MSDAGPGPRRSVVEDALVVAATVPESEHDRAVAGLVAAHAVGLARDARRHVRASGVTGTDRAAALRAVTDAQRAVLDDLVTGRRPLDGRAWAPTVRFEAVRAVRALAADGTVVVPPYRHRLAADRVALLVLRESAAVVDLAAPREVVRTGAVVAGIPAAPHAVGDATALCALPAARPAPAVVPARSPARRGRRALVARGRARSTVQGRSVRWGAAAVLSAATLVFGVAVAPAADEVGPGPGVSARPEQVLLGTAPGTGSTGWAPLDGAGAAAVRLDLSAPVLTGLAPSTAPAVELVDEPADESVDESVGTGVVGDAADEPVDAPLPVVVPAAPGPADRETTPPAPAPAPAPAPPPAPAAAPKPTPAAPTPSSKPTPKPAPATRPAPTPVPARPAPPVTRPAPPKPDRPAPRPDDARGSSRPGTAKPQPQTHDDRRTDKDAGRQDRGHGGGRGGRG
ncbi:hypothetical protein DBB34_09355 [Sphaerisporangium cinnabarinum]|nr:hypothetical protein [Sphaerisporangium cinnabarinum]PTU56367.1 hypothetical protein DBB34_09355 [Sphaerisporangium cinnabarinum]